MTPLTLICRAIEEMRLLEFRYKGAWREVELRGK